MLLNELAQWAVLLFIAIFVIGLTRQLGNFIMPKRERVDLDIGPRVGDLVSDRLFSEAESRAIRELITASSLDWGTLVVLHDHCSGCSTLLDGVDRKGKPRDAVMVALTRDEAADHVDRLRRLSDMTIVDGQRLDDAELFTAPFVLMVDADLRVLHKDVTPDLHSTVNAWLAQRTESTAADQWRAAHSSTAPSFESDGKLQLVQIEGRSGAQ
jgi:hypothetical protein